MGRTVQASAKTAGAALEFLRCMRREAAGKRKQPTIEAERSRRLPISGSPSGKTRRTERREDDLRFPIRRCEAPHMGLAAADTKGQAAEGAMWVKMNVKEKSTGEFRMRGARGGGGEGARERDGAVQNQVPDMGLALPKTRPRVKENNGISSRVPDMGLEPMTSRLRVCHSTN